MPPITFHSSALGGGSDEWSDCITPTNTAAVNGALRFAVFDFARLFFYASAPVCHIVHWLVLLWLFTLCHHVILRESSLRGDPDTSDNSEPNKKSYSSLFTKHFHHTFHSYKQPPPPSLILSLSDRDTWPKSHHSLSPALHSEVKWDDRLIAIASKRGHWCVKRENGRRVMETERELGCTCRRGGQGESEKIDCAAVRWWAIFNEKETEWIDFRSTSA